MSGAWDARIRLVYVVDDKGSSATDTIAAGAPLDVLANIIVGATLMQVVTKATLFVSVRNLSQLTVPLRGQHTVNLTPRSTTLRQTLQVPFAGGWDSDDGDILDVIAAFKVQAGIHVDHSHAQGPRLVVSEATTGNNRPAD
jgi:hypothetical protein